MQQPKPLGRTDYLNSPINTIGLAVHCARNKVPFLEGDELLRDHPGIIGSSAVLDHGLSRNRDHKRACLKPKTKQPALTG